MHVLDFVILKGTLKRECIVIPFGSNCAATPLDAVASATKPSPLTASSNAVTTNVLPVPPAAFMQNIFPFFL